MYDARVHFKIDFSVIPPVSNYVFEHVGVSTLADDRDNRETVINTASEFALKNFPFHNYIMVITFQSRHH